MHILYITPYKFIKPNAGGQFAMHQQIKYMAALTKVTVVGVSNNEADSSLECPVLPLLGSGSSRYYNPVLIFKLSKLIKQNKITHVIVEHPYYAWLVFALKVLCRVRVYIRSQNVEYLRFKDLGKKWWPILKVYEKWAHNMANGVLCITEDDKLFFKQQGIRSTLIDMPFGTAEAASATDKVACKQAVQQQLSLAPNTNIILYNGSLGYLPNKIGLDIIIEKINPYLQANFSNYIILVCGGGLAPSYNALKDIPNVHYCGFVDDIAQYFKAADVFINPVQGGGGIKTKLVDALSFGTTAISSANGANGLVKSVVQNKLIITPDYDGVAMAKAIINVCTTNNNEPTPSSYYNYYYWPNIVANVLKAIQ
jgi:polysaccharide biosynthesis protein PslH